MKSNQLIAKFADVLRIQNESGFPATGIIMSSPGGGKTTTLEFYSKVKDCNIVSLIASLISLDNEPSGATE